MNDGLFQRTLETKIEFHRTNQNDPHNVGNAAIAILSEVLDAARSASQPSTASEVETLRKQRDILLDAVESALMKSPKTLATPILRQAIAQVQILTLQAKGNSNL